MKVNVIKIVADKDGMQISPPLYYNGSGATTENLAEAKHYSKLAGRVMIRHCREVVKLHPRCEIQFVEESIVPNTANTPDPQPPSDAASEDGHVDESTKKEGMTSHMNKYRENYSDAVSYAGKKSKVSGDEVSLLLIGLSPEEVMKAAEEVLGLPVDELVNRYGKLNAGQRRMNAGNRIRAAIKRGDITFKQVEGVIH